MQKLAERIARGDWEKYKRDKDIEPCYQARQELSDAEGLVFWGDRIVLPDALREILVSQHKQYD